jgi:hypothetical protein
MKQYIHFLIVFIVLNGLLSSCRTTIVSKPPPEAYQTFQYKPPVSQVIVPIELSLRDMETSLNQQLNGLIYMDNDYSDNMLMKVWKVSPILISMKGEDIIYDVPIKISTKIRWEFNQFGISMSDEYDADAAIRLSFSTKLKIDAFWNIQPQTTLLKYEWIEKPVVSGGNIALPVTMIADHVIKSQQKLITKAIDDEMAKQVQLRKYVEEGWNAIHQPIQLNKNPDTWLRISPNVIMVTPITGTTDFAYATIRIDGITETFIGSKPSVVLTNLPNMQASNAMKGNFSISLVNDITYEEVTRLANTYLVGQVFSSSNGKKKIKIDSMRIYAGGDNLVIQTKVSGNMNGTIYLTGKPAYDSTSQSIYLTDIDYSLDTKNALHKTGAWLLHSTLAKKIESGLRYSIAKELADSKKQINAYISNYSITKNITVKAQLNTLSPKEFFITSRSIKAVIHTNGTMKMFVKGLDIP